VGRLNQTKAALDAAFFMPAIVLLLQQSVIGGLLFRGAANTHNAFTRATSRN
jgi:hypothetical protein